MARQSTILSSRTKTTRKNEIPGSVFGHIRGVQVGKTFENRKALSASYVHPPLVAGIYGRKADGARSVVLAGEYDDEDHGDSFVYIGSGGREPGVRMGPQTCDQSFDNNLNESLRISALRKNPVRVIRGSGLNSKYAPHEGFRYDGLYKVSNPRIEMGPKGFRVCKFDFTRCTEQSPFPAWNTGYDTHRSDIEIRRAQYKDYRTNMNKPRTSSLPATSTSQLGPDTGSGMRDSPISISEEEEEDQEDIFGDIDDVEVEMEPVSAYLDLLQRPLSETEKKKRTKLLLPIGRHVNKILQVKRELGKDEGGRDEKWWYDALWSYVASAMPVDKIPTPEQVEDWFNKREDKMQKLKQSRASPTSG